MAKKMLTTTDAADLLDCSTSAVKTICRANNIGRLVSARQRILVESDIAKIRAILQEKPGWQKGRKRK